MDKKLSDALLRVEPVDSKIVTEGLSKPLDLPAFPEVSGALEATTAIRDPAAASSYGLDPTGDFDLAAVNAETLLALEQHLTEDAEGVLASAQQFFDAKLTEVELRGVLQKARSYVEHPDPAVAVLESMETLESAVKMPSGWGFEGYDAAKVPISPMDTRFETVADGAVYAANWVAAKLANAFRPKPPFPQHSAASPFVYDCPDRATKIGVLGDFGNGLAHSRYIAKHLRASRLDHLLYLGDVYYSGTSKEFAAYVAPEIEPFLTGDIVGGEKVNVMMLNSNHEMFSKGYSYFSYLKYRLAKGAPQRQQGSYFALRFGTSFQIVAVDTDYGGYMKFRDPRQIGWLKQRLAEGRRTGAVNILLTANEPFEYGKKAMTDLFDDMKSFLPSVDLWLWGNTHYCGLFDRTDTLPMSSCLGHGGYPYKLHENRLDKNPYQAPCPATPFFLETRSRYQGTGLRPDLGNNGYALMHLEPRDGSRQARVRLEYWDWMKHLRYHAVLGRDEKQRLSLIEGEES